MAFDVSLGFAGRFRPGSWVPVQVQVANEGVPFNARVEVITAVGHPFSPNPGYVVFRRPVALPSGARKQLLINVPISSTYRPIDVRLVEMNGNVLSSQRISLRDAGITSDIVLVLDTTGQRWTWLQEVVRVASPLLQHSRVYVAHAQSVTDLPAEWVAYESVRTIVLTDTFPVTSLSEEQLDAILMWVESGGHLLVAGGANMGLRNVPALANNLPVTLDSGTSVVTVRDFGRDLSPLPQPLRVVAWNARPGKGRVRVAAEDVPLVAIGTLGTGCITYIGFDLAAPPLREWSDLDSFSRALVFPPRMVRRTTESLERNLLPLLASQQIPYPRHVWLAIFLSVYLAAVAGTLRAARTYPLAWLVLTGVVAAGASYAGVIIAYQARQSMQAYGEIRISQVPPKSGLALSFAVAQMVRMQGGDWVLQQESGAYLAPAANVRLRAGEVLVVEQNDGEARLGPTEARRALAVTSQQMEDIPVRASIARKGLNLQVTLENNTPWQIRNAFYIDRERYAYLGDVAAGTSAETSLPADRFIVASDSLSPQWTAASVAAVAERKAPGSDKRQLEAMAQIVVHALTADRYSLDLPWGTPLILALIDTPTRPPLAESFFGRGYHFLVIPLSSLSNWEGIG